MAGEGCEYDWGTAKIDYRRTNLLVPKKFHTNVMASLATVTRRKRIIFSRRARTYRRALTAVHNTGTSSFDKIISMVGTYKAHRNAVDFDSAFLKSIGDGACVTHPGSAAHYETYHESVTYVKEAQRVFAVANVTTPSLGRKLKPNVAVQVEVEHAKLEKQQRQQAALDWVVSVANRMGL
eukprot:COSAG01_NODE_11369_length_1951_cov_1.386069_1_plen_180_part_00